jgi:thioredoxin 1
MKYGIQSIPCLIVLKNGEAVDRSVGFLPGPQIAAWIEGNLG